MNFSHRKGIIIIRNKEEWGFVKMIRIVLAEDNVHMQRVLKKTLELDEDLELVGIASNGNEIIDIVEKKNPDIVLMDINMPGRDGLDCAREIKERFPSVSVVILTVIDDTFTIFEALKVGANGYFLKSSPPEHVIKNIKLVHDGGILLPPEISQKIQDMFFYILNLFPPKSKTVLNSLSNRELDVLKLVVSGKTNAEIAKTLCLSKGTVKNYISTLLRKFEVKDRVNLVLYALRAGIKL